MRETPVCTAADAIYKLAAGNLKYLNAENGSGDISRRIRMSTWAKGQSPYAIIVTCSDSRVIPENIFSAGIGELFVIRLAGNIIDDHQLGSIEYAAGHLGCRLVVVLGHTHCGAISATIEQLLKPVENQSRNLQSIVDRVRPSIEGLLHTELRNDPQALALHGMRANIGVSVSHLRHGSVVLEKLIRDDGLRIVGAEYSVQTGAVTFLDGAHASG